MTRPFRPSIRGLGLGAFGLAALLSVLGVPITSAQGTTVFAARADGTLPVDAPFDAAWDGAPAVDVPLSGQIAVPPMSVEPTITSVRVRSLVDDDRIAILLEWADPSVDDSVLRVDSFADAVAVQFALGTGTSICMGQQAGGLNIWHWKADWAADLADRRDVEDVHPGMPDDPHFGADAGETGPGHDGFFSGDMAGNPRSAASHPSAVEDLNAVGFGSLTPQEPAGQNVSGSSAHRDGTWRVVLSRRLSDGDPNDAVIRAGSAAVVVAFAAWDGSHGDRDGQKSVSSWLALSIPPKPFGFLDMWPMLLLLGLALFLSALVVAYGARQPAIGLGWPNGGPDGGGHD